MDKSLKHGTAALNRHIKYRLERPAANRPADRRLFMFNCFLYEVGHLGVQEGKGM